MYRKKSVIFANKLLFMKKLLLTAFIALPIGFSAYAQSMSPAILNAGGGSATLNGNTFEWSIGEMVLVNTAHAGNLIVTQGLLQPLKTNGSTGLEVDQFVMDHVKVYPNPTENIFYIETDFHAVGELYCVLYDMSGKIVENKKLAINNQSVKVPFNISALAGGLYSLTIAFTGEGNTSKAVYKIEKTN